MIIIIYRYSGRNVNGGEEIDFLRNGVEKWDFKRIGFLGNNLNLYRFILRLFRVVLKFPHYFYYCFENVSNTFFIKYETPIPHPWPPRRYKYPNDNGRHWTLYSRRAQFDLKNYWRSKYYPSIVNIPRVIPWGPLYIKTEFH